jgi:TonB family protein
MWRSLGAVLLACWALYAVASAQSPPTPITQPVWITAPSQGALPYPLTSREYRSAVELTCQVSTGRLSDCAPTATDTAENFLVAARAAAAAANLAELDAEGRSTNGRTITLTVRFPPLGIPVAIDPPRAPPITSMLTTVSWLERPTAADFARYYPPEAARRGIDGRVVLDCIVSGVGRLSCTVISQDPESEGFGDAALRLSRHFRMAPQTQDGRPTAGGRTRVPIAFRISG